MSPKYKSLQPLSNIDWSCCPCEFSDNSATAIKRDSTQWYQPYLCDFDSRLCIHIVVVGRKKQKKQLLPDSTEKLHPCSGNHDQMSTAYFSEVVDKTQPGPWCRGRIIFRQVYSSFLNFLSITSFLRSHFTYVFVWALSHFSTQE